MAKKYDDEDDDDMPSVRKKEPLTGLNGMFANTSMVVLIIFALCCNGLCYLPFILSLIGVLTCTDETAKSNARLCLIISGIMSVIITIGGVIRNMNAGPGGGFGP
jgi:hypothetical protein